MILIFLKRKRVIFIAILGTLVLFSTIFLNALKCRRKFTTVIEYALNQPNRCTYIKTRNTYGKSVSNFPLFIPHVQPRISCEERLLEAVVVVNSACEGLKHRHLRTAIRKTWGNVKKRYSSKQYRVFFSLGMCRENTLSIEESEKNNDIIIGNFTDSYGNVKFKTFMALQWAYYEFSSKYIIKTDDDIYVRVPRMLNWLQVQTYPAPFYGGFLYTHALVDRRPRSNWYISYEEYKDDFWPPFALGACTVFSSESIPLYLNYTQHRNPFKTDDAYIGVAAYEYGIIAIHMRGFKLWPSSKKAIDLANATVIGDDLDGSQMESYYNISSTENLV